MSLAIDQVRGAKDIDTFQSVPYLIYADNPHYVFPLLGEQKNFLDPKHNPFHKHAETALWIARRDGRAVGRVAACIDSHNNDHHQEKAGFFGFFETIDEAEVARALLATARDWLSERGMQIMRGPSCFTTNHDYLGLLVDGFDADPRVGMPYNPPYYADHLEAFGLTKAKDLWAWNISGDGSALPAKLQKLVDGIEASATFTVRPFRMDRFDEEARIVRALYNDCWSQNWGFIPLDDEEFAYIAKDMKSMVDASLLLIAELEGKPIGFAITIPDFNEALKPVRGKLFPFGWLKFLLAKRKIGAARTPLMGVLPQHRKKGVDVMLVYRTFQAGYALGYYRGECSWILEDNRSMNLILRSYGASNDKTYRVYELPLS